MKVKFSSKYINQFKLYYQEYFDMDYQKFKVEERKLQRLVKLSIADNSMEDYETPLKLCFNHYLNFYQPKVINTMIQRIWSLIVQK